MELKECVVSPGKASLIIRSGGKKGAGRSKVGTRFKLSLFEKGSKKETECEEKSEAGNQSKKVRSQLRLQDVEYDEDPEYGSSIVIKSHNL